MKRILFALFWLALSGTVSAQVTSRLGRFQVDKNQGCAPFTVTITNTNLATTGQCTPGAPCLMFYEGGSACAPGTTTCQNILSYTYSKPGTYTLQILYGSLTPGIDDVQITVDQNTQPDFEIYRCSNNDVTIKVTDNKYEQYVINFGDSSPEVAIPFSNNATAVHNYAAAPPSFNIGVRGKDSNPNAADVCTPKVQSVTTLATLPTPAITTVTALGPTSVRLALPATTPTFILYKLEIAVNNGATFQVLQNVYNQTSIDVSNLLLDNNYYCFRLSAFDACTNANKYSNTICTQDFDVNFTNGTNKLSWKTSTTGIASVTITRKNMSDNTAQTTTLPGAPLTYNDADYDCNIQYCYTLTTNYSASTKSISLEKCGVGVLITTHPAVDDVLATIPGAPATGVNLKWTIDPKIDLNEFQVLRSTGSAPFVTFTTTKDTDTNDPTYTTVGVHCYRINYNDNCDNYSADGVIACPVRLTGGLGTANVATLNWSKYTGWKGGVSSYTVERLRPNGTIGTTFPVALDTTLVDDTQDFNNQVVSYRIKVTPVTGTVAAYSNVVTFIKEINLAFPTAFTPNGDGLNDVFTISGHYVTKMNIRIFDRWGGLVFGSEKNDAWNGGREGTAMPEGSYIWKADITDQAGRTFSEQGNVILLRK